MIIQILLISIFTFLAFYGLLHIVMEIVSGVSRRNKDDLCRAYTVITVKDRESSVEGIIRAAAWRQLRLANRGNVPEIYAVDLDSTDKTYEILQKLALEYDFLKPLRKYEYISSLSAKQ
ncbi:MAG: hypothetical protein FWE04_08745 [Oscillospiraceae bacterium]|nr:hypothetical protein [Oscillospiraceae bacterium]